VDSLIELVKTLNAMSPLGLAAMLALVLFFQARQRKTVTQLRDNHMHDVTDGLAAVTEALTRIEVQLARIETLLRNGHA